MAEEDAGKPKTPVSEEQGKMYAQKIFAYIERHRGRFAKGEDGSLHLIVDGKRIPLDAHHKNYAFKDLMIAAAGVTTVTPGARAAIERLQARALSQADALLLRKFSAMGKDCLYVPIKGGEVLKVTVGEVAKVPNGEGAGKIWLEHPFGSPLVWTPGLPAAGLEAFERLLVEKQTAAVSAMKWFVAMHCGLFPYVRDVCSARAILELRGDSGCGKTTACERFTRLAGLGSIFGDVTVAALNNLGDTGLLALDNKEQTNLTQPFIDHLLFLATGAQRQRSHSDGSMRQAVKGRPAVIFTTIEGAIKAELLRRCIPIECYLPKSTPKIPQEPIEEEIEQRRHEIGSALVLVLQKWLTVRAEPRPIPEVMSDFVSHFRCLADLLRAYGEVAGKPEAWADRIIQDWAETISGQGVEESELEHPLRRVIKEGLLDEFSSERIVHDGETGVLYVTTAGVILTALQKAGYHNANLTPDGLSRRLHTTSFKTLRILDEKRAPNLPNLKRTTKMRPLGIFVLDED